MPTSKKKETLAYKNIREEEMKNKIARDYFANFDCTKILGDVDFCVTLPLQDGLKQESLFEAESLLWAEAKKGNKNDIYESFVQLILTIGKARTFDKHIPPLFLGAFDAEKIAFIPYNDIHDIFYQNDFNWNVTPSNHETKEFKQVYKKVTKTIEKESSLFAFNEDDQELRDFIKTNFVIGKINFSKIRIDKNNFTLIYLKWLVTVKPTINVNWDIAKKHGIIDGDFYLADVLSRENETLKDKLYVLLKIDHYEMDRKIDDMGMFSTKNSQFTDGQKSHTIFWNKYERPPNEDYWDYLVERRDLLVPQDVRERKGSFFTPHIWVELSQKYITSVLGEDWQDEYYIWDCAAGTGNLLAGLTNKYNIWASTLDKQDVDVMHDRIKNGANLLVDHVFTFDFLNDDFNKLPTPLQEIIKDPEKRKKLVIYINPPYAEHGNRTTISDHGEHKANVSNTSKVYNEFNKVVGTATRELFAQFFLRIHKELPESILASFSTVKFINSQNFSKFRKYFKADYKKGFICNANTFDNVKGNFPIGFFIWDLKSKVEIKNILTDIIENEEQGVTEKKSFYVVDNKDFISTWLRKFYDKTSKPIAYLILPGVDMQQQSGVYFTAQPTESDIKQHKTTAITEKNLIVMAIYLAARQCLSPDWKNNKDQFLFPNDKWKADIEFQNDCLIYSLFHGQNKVSCIDGINNWIPFTEQEVNSKEKFESNFMSKFINGKIKIDTNIDLFGSQAHRSTPLIFSLEATDVLNSARELWTYYHIQPHHNVNASFYDIREYFQGRNENGKMNNSSDDKIYMSLIQKLRDKNNVLGNKIKLKVYEYEFLKI